MENKHRGWINGNIFTWRSVFICGGVKVWRLLTCVETDEQMGVYGVKWNEVSRQIYDTLTQLACMLAMLQSGIHVWPELCYKKHRKSNKITKRNSFSEEGANYLTRQFARSPIFTSHWHLLPTVKCNSVVHIMKGKEVQILSISVQYSALSFLFLYNSGFL